MASLACFIEHVFITMNRVQGLTRPASRFHNNWSRSLLAGPFYAGKYKKCLSLSQETLQMI